MIIVLGLPKTGTYTIHHALSCAGIVSAHGRVPGYMPLAVQLWSAYIECKPPLINLPREIQAIADPYVTTRRGHCWPLMDEGLVESLKDKDIQFILNYRNVDDWVSSVTRWKDLRDRMFLNGLIKEREDGELSALHALYYHSVRTILQDENIVEFDIADPNAKQILSDFLNVELPWWGVKNANPETKCPTS